MSKKALVCVAVLVLIFMFMVGCGTSQKVKKSIESQGSTVISMQKSPYTQQDETLGELEIWCVVYKDKQEIKHRVIKFITTKGEGGGLTIGNSSKEDFDRLECTNWE